jgi:hypothetical protein
MATAYTTSLKLALPTQGELTGTWGDTLNNQVTSMVEEAVAGLKTINTWSTNSATLSTANGTTAEARAAILSLTDTTSDLSGAATLICPAASKVYIVKNATGQTVTVKTASGSGIAISNGNTTMVFCDGTNVVEAVTGITGNLDVGGNLVAATADINGGTADNVVIGGSTAAAITGTTLVANTSLNIAGDGATVTGIKDEDDMSSNSNTKLATQQSIKAYVDATVTAQDLDFQADSGGALNIDLDSETLTLTGGTGVDTSGSGNAVTFAIDSTVATLAGSQSLTNKTIDVDNNTVSNIEVDNLKSGVLDTDLSSVSGSDDTLASAKSIKTYVDAQVTAQDLDVTTDSGTIDIDLDSEALTIAGGEGIDTSASGTTITIAGEDASTSNKGVASFHSDNFAVSSGAVTIKDGGVVTDEIADANVTLAKIANQAANTVLVRDANSSGVLSAKALATTQILIGDGTGFTAAALSGDVTMTNAGVVTIAAGAVENSMLADDAVGADELAANAVVTNSIVDDNVTQAKIADDAVGADQLAANAVVNASIASGAAIADTKLATISTANKISLTALDIDGGTDIGEAVADADLFIVDNGAGGTNRKVTASALKTYTAGASASKGFATAMAIAL